MPPTWPLAPRDLRTGTRARLNEPGVRGASTRSAAGGRAGVRSAAQPGVSRRRGSAPSDRRELRALRVALVEACRRAFESAGSERRLGHALRGEQAGARGRSRRGGGAPIGRIEGAASDSSASQAVSVVCQQQSAERRAQAVWVTLCEVRTRHVSDPGAH